jgi:hypothetical protein
VFAPGYDLDFHGALNGGQRAGEFDEEAVAGGFDFLSLMFRENGTEQLPVFFEQIQRERQPTMSVNMMAASRRCSVELDMG